MHPVQMAIASAHGSQCGFCTPGFVMSMYALLLNSRNKDTAENRISLRDIEEALFGNLWQMHRIQTDFERICRRIRGE